MTDLITKLEYSFDFERVKSDVLKLVEQYPTISQINLTHSSKSVTQLEKITEGSGSFIDKTTGSYRFQETDFNQFNSEYTNTSLYEIYKAIPHIGRFRIMVMDGPKCYSIHKDNSKRFHYVIETNPKCLFLFPSDDKMLHIPADGNVYLLNTLHNHTFVNGSFKRRIHLVMEDLSSFAL